MRMINSSSLLSMSTFCFKLECTFSSYEWWCDGNFQFLQFPVASLLYRGEWYQWTDRVI